MGLRIGGQQTEFATTAAIEPVSTIAATANNQIKSPEVPKRFRISAEMSVSVQTTAGENPKAVHQRLLREAASRAGLDGTTQQEQFVAMYENYTLEYQSPAQDRTPNDGKTISSADIKTGDVPYKLEPDQIAALKKLQKEFLATGGKLRAGKSYQTPPPANSDAAAAAKAREIAEQRRLNDLMDKAQVIPDVFGTPSKLRDLKHISLPVDPKTTANDKDAVLLSYIEQRYGAGKTGGNIWGNAQREILQLAKSKGVALENLTVANGTANFDISVENLLKLHHAYIGVQEKVNAEIEIANNTIANQPHNRFAQGVFEGAWGALKENWEMITDPVTTVSEIVKGVGTLAKAGAMLAAMPPLERSALFAQLATAGVKGLAEMPVADAAHVLGKIVGAAAVELALGKGIGAALSALKGTRIGAALIADAANIAKQIKQGVGNLPVPTAVNAVEIALTDGSHIRMPQVETKRLEDIVLQMKQSSEKLDMLENGTAAGRDAITETAEQGLSENAQASAKRVKGEMRKDALKESKERLVTLNVARTEMLARLDNIANNANLSPATRNDAQTAMNAIRDHLTQDDLAGALRDVHGKPVTVSGSGRTYDHLGEVRDALDSLRTFRTRILNEMRDRAMREARSATPDFSQYQQMSKDADATTELITKVEEFLEIGK